MIHESQSAQILQKQDGRNIYAIMKIAYITRGHIVFMIAYILRPSCFCEIWGLCVSWITYDHLYYASCLASRALFGSLVPEMCSCTSCAQVHELAQTYCGDNRESTLLSWLHNKVTIKLELQVCRILDAIYALIWVCALRFPDTGSAKTTFRENLDNYRSVHHFGVEILQVLIFSFWVGSYFQHFRLIRLIQHFLLQI